MPEMPEVNEDQDEPEKKLSQADLDKLPVE